MRIIAAIASFAGAVGPAIAAWEWPEGLQQQVEEAAALQEQGKDEEALELLNGLLADTTPLGRSRVYASIAELERRRQRHPQAQAAYENALAANAASPREQFELTEALDDEYWRAANHERGRQLLNGYLSVLDETVPRLPAIGADNIENSREAFEAARGDVLYRLARHDQAEGKTIDAAVSIEAAIASTPRPRRVWREYRVELWCSTAERGKCAESVVGLARAGDMAASKADEIDRMLQSLADEPAAQPALQAAKAANLVSSDNRIVWRLPPGYFEAVFLVRVAPEYPRKAFREKISGSIAIDFEIGADGKPTDTRIVASDPPGVFDAAALEAFSRWRYAPVVVDGKPIAARSIARMQFRPE